jgi:WD40 repeat protein
MSSLNVEAPPRGKTELVARYQHAFGDYAAALAISPDGRLAAIGLGDGRLVAIALDDGRVLFDRAVHPGGVLAVSIGERAIATSGQEPTAKLWSFEGEHLRDLPSDGRAWAEHVAFAPKGDRLATAAGRKVRIWTASGDPIVETEALESTVTGLAWRFDGTALAAICYGGVHVLPFVPGAKVRHLPWKGSLISIAWSPDGKVVACSSQDDSVHFWRLSSGQDSEMAGYPCKPKALAWDAESKLLATSGDRSPTLWKFVGKGPEGTKPIQLEGHQAPVTKLAFDRSGLLASGAQDSSVLLFRPRQGTKPIRFAFLEDEITALAWDTARSTLLAADARGHLAGWSVEGVRA